MDILDEARKIFDIEIEALKKTRDNLGVDFEKIVKIVTECTGKVIVTGIGKPGHIAKKISATLASLGTSAFYIHPAEAMHGDLGMVSDKDVVMLISYSGESDEIIRILPNLKLIGARLIGITANATSTLARYVDVAYILPKFEEACYMGLAPTSSTTVELCLGDAIAVIASRIHGYNDYDFGKVHPAGSLGKKLLITVKELMASGDDNPKVFEKVLLKDAVVELSKKGLGAVNICDSENNLLGIITDGDLRRALENELNIYSLNVEDIMTTSPVTINANRLAVEALNIMRDRNLSCLPVINAGKVTGLIRLQDIIKAGIVG